MVSSALETSVGIAAGVALAAALPELPFACGLATVQLLTDDPVAESLLPVDGALPGAAAGRRRGGARPAGRRRRTGSRTGRPGSPRCGRCGRIVDRDHPSTELARAVVDALVEAGVTEVVIAPGSRNAPLSFAAYDAAPAGLVRLHTRIDERTAGFLALGLTQVGARAAVICTSGTAVANLHPAVLEAAHAGLPLVVVTADRPARLRGTDANQTTDQVGIFGPLVRRTIDLARRRELGCCAERTGRLHLNVQLDDPLVPDDRWAPEVVDEHESAGARPSRRTTPAPARPAHGRGRR